VGACGLRVLWRRTHTEEDGDAMLCYVMLCYVMLCGGVPTQKRTGMLCYAMLCYVMLCYAMWRRTHKEEDGDAMLCYAMLCYANLTQRAGVMLCYVAAYPQRRGRGCSLCSKYTVSGKKSALSGVGERTVASLVRRA
jgi:hypothetical protein